MPDPNNYVERPEVIAARRSIGVLRNTPYIKNNIRIPDEYAQGGSRQNTWSQAEQDALDNQVQAADRGEYNGYSGSSILGKAREMGYGYNDNTTMTKRDPRLANAALNNAFRDRNAIASDRNEKIDPRYLEYPQQQTPQSFTDRLNGGFNMDASEFPRRPQPNNSMAQRQI